MYNDLESKGISSTIEENIPEFLDATNQIDRIITPIGNWGGDLGKLVSFIFNYLFVINLIFKLFLFCSNIKL